MTGISKIHFALRLMLAILMGAAFLIWGLLLEHDPAAMGRIVLYVVSGVGFLDAGVIFKNGSNVQGLNTAATIWCSAAIGALSGLGALNLALVLTITIPLTNLLLRPIAYCLHPVLPEAVPVETLYEVRLVCNESATARIRSLLLSTIGQLPLTLQSIHSHQDNDAVETEIRAEVITAGRNNEVLEQIVMRHSIECDVSNLSWTIVESALEMA